MWGSFLRYIWFFFKSRSYDLLEANHIWRSVNMFGLCRCHVTLPWTKIKCTSQKILTCKISIGPWGAELQTLPCQQDVRKTGLCCPPFIFEGLHPWLNCLFTAAPRMGGWWLIFCCKKILKLFINFICDMVSIVCGGAGSGLGGRGARLALVAWGWLAQAEAARAWLVVGDSVTVSISYSETVSLNTQTRDSVTVLM